MRRPSPSSAARVGLAALCAAALSCSDSSGGGGRDVAFVIGDAQPDPDAEPGDAGDGSGGLDAAGLDGAGLDAGGPDAAVGIDAAPDLGFVDGGTICDEAATAVLTSTDAANRAAELDGRVVDVEGTLVVRAIRCTTRPCPPDNPCCNTCSAVLGLGRVSLVEGPCFSDVGCLGTECGLVCRPPALGIPGVYRGVLRAGDPVRLELIR